MIPDIKKILVPIDFSDYSKSALRYSVNFAKLFNAELNLVYVIEPVVYPPDFSMGQIAFPQVDVQLDERANDELNKLAKTEIPQGMACNVLIKTGKPFVEIIELASELDIDLIIIASHGHTRTESILFGSTAEKVVRKSPCPVLSLRVPLKGFDYKEEFNK